MNEKIVKLNNSDFFDFIGKADKPVLVDFYAEWCGPCKMQSPIIDEVAEELSDKITVAKVDTDDCYDVCMKYRIASIPTLMLFKGGEAVETKVGLTSKAEIAQMVIKYL
ncbi:MAG: thioredoxin [Clostridia bacterium]|nr:thioredoxin [Clostridia bacterium]